MNARMAFSDCTLCVAVAPAKTTVAMKIAWKAIEVTANRPDRRFSVREWKRLLFRSIE